MSEEQRQSYVGEEKGGVESTESLLGRHAATIYNWQSFSIPMATLGKGCGEEALPSEVQWEEGERSCPGSAAAARKFQRLLKFQEKLEPQLGPSRLQLLLRGDATPQGPYREPRAVALTRRFQTGKFVSSQPGSELTKWGG